MNSLPFDISCLIGPLLGAVIGYFTNFIAVRMLFYPKREVRIFGLRLPFTPGAIPKGKKRLAETIGRVVSETLITKEAIAGKLLEEECKNTILDTLMQQLERPLKDEVMLLMDSTEEEYEARKKKLSVTVGEKLSLAVSEAKIPDPVVDRCVEAVRDRAKNPLLHMLLKEKKLRSWILEIAEGFQEEVGKQGSEFFEPEVLKLIDETTACSGIELGEKLDISKEELRSVFYASYRKLVLTGTEKMIEAIDIADIIRAKIDDMSIDELERMVLKVMKKELSVIVNLGALIGFLIGLLNLVFR
ncbi:MAG: DUF445 family protein [Lachnospiraceae bacterium]|nr:DUF445 family protein [Lachnospiraceae bacterium]